MAANPKTPELRWIVSHMPEETISRCSDIVSFIGTALSAMGDAGFSIDAVETDACARLLWSVRDALEYERERAEIATAKRQKAVTS